MSLSPENRQAMKALYNALADRILTPDEKEYVLQVNCRPDEDVVSEIANEIDWQEGGGVCLLTGQRGTGKSTELQRLKVKLEQFGATVIYVDLAEFLPLTKPVEISDFLVSICGALSEQLQSSYGESPGQRSYWDRISAFLQTRINIDDLSAGLGPLALKAALKDDPDFKLKVQEAVRGHIAQLVRDAHHFAGEAVDFVRQKEADPNRKVVLLIDSVEQIRGLGNEAMQVYESVRELFFAHAEHLRIPKLHLVYTVPPYLPILAARTDAMHGAMTRRLVSTHVFKDRSRDVDPAGLEVIREVITARYPEWKKLISLDALNRLSVSSGGDLRELFRLVRQCLPSVRDDSQLPLSSEAVKPIENLARNEMLPIPADHLAWLKRIGETHDTCLETNADLPVLAHFLDTGLVLSYRNGSDWYDVHPLLRSVVDRHDPGT